MAIKDLNFLAVIRIFRALALRRAAQDDFALQKKIENPQQRRLRPAKTGLGAGLARGFGGGWGAGAGSILYKNI